MAVTMLCPNLKCRKVLVVPDAARETKVRCAYCGTMCVVPPKRRTKPNGKAEHANVAG